MTECNKVNVPPQKKIGMEAFMPPAISVFSQNSKVSNGITPGQYVWINKMKKNVKKDHNIQYSIPFASSLLLCSFAFSLPEVNTPQGLKKNLKIDLIKLARKLNLQPNQTQQLLLKFFITSPF